MNSFDFSNVSRMVGLILESNHRVYSNYPIEGVDFVDFSPLYASPVAIQIVLDWLRKDCKVDTYPTVVLLPESRGFLWASLLTIIGVPSILLRKKILPVDISDTLYRCSYIKEYGEDTLYFRRSDFENAEKIIDSQCLLDKTPSKINVVFFDDVLATGGTAVSVAKVFKENIAPTTKFKLSSFVFLGAITVCEGSLKICQEIPDIPIHIAAYF